MALTKTQSEIWQAMNVGPQWILRSGADPLVPEEPALEKESAKDAEPSPIKAPMPAAVRLERKPTPTPFTQPKTEKTVSELVPNTELQKAAAGASWTELSELVSRCKACPMALTRKHCVFADGCPGCPVVIVGEAPGRDEDIQGIPFVGKSGQLLTLILDSVGLKRGTDVAIVNVLKCRPPNNRDPLPNEAEACAAFLDRQLELLKPEVLILTGRIAINRLLHSDQSIGRLRTSVHSVCLNGRDVPTVVTYHPSYLLRNPVDKEKSWRDFVTAKRLLRGEKP